MAIYNEILVGRFARGLQKLFGIKGTVPAKQLSGELMPTHPLFNGVENRYLEGWGRFMEGAALAASAANINGVRLRNPANSKVAVVLEKMVFNAQTGANGLTLSFGAATTDLTTPFGTTFARLDPRGQPSPSLIASFQQTPTITDLAVAFLIGNIGINGFYEMIVDENQELTIFPGDALQIRSTQVNLATSWTWIWRERVLEDSETQ